jgi:hypothetical protein
MKFHPILFSTEMVKAILAGRKHMTRRIIEPQPVYDCESGRVFDGKHKRSPFDMHNWREPFADYFSKWIVGDVLWVRETIFSDRDKNALYKADESFVYLNNEPKLYDTIDISYFTDKRNYVPGIHMPKTACRIFLQIKSVKVESLQEISEADAITEGIESSISGNGRIVYKHYLKPKYGPSPIHSFQTLWESINGPESWNANPWVWVIEFEQISKPKNFN